MTLADYNRMIADGVDLETVAMTNFSKYWQFFARLRHTRSFRNDHTKATRNPGVNACHKCLAVISIKNGEYEDIYVRLSMCRRS